MPMPEELNAMLSGESEEETKEEIETPEEKLETEEQPVEEETPEGASDEKSEDESDDEITELKKQIEAMREALAAISSTKMAEQSTRSEEPVVDEINFMDGIEMEDLQEDPKVFNAILNKVLQQGVKLGRESILRDIPSIITYNVRQQTALKSAIDKFYEENKDLLPFKRVVGAVAEELMSSNPELSLDDLFAKSAVEARKRLALVKQATGQAPNAARRPATPLKQRGGRMRPAEIKLNPMEEDVLNMIKGAR